MNLKELSKILGLSQTTVSRALNGYPEVNEATRIKVLAAAKAHNYSPNLRAQSLATGRSNAIGHVIPMASSHEMVNPIFGDFISGAGEVYAANNYEMLLSIVQDGGEENVYRGFKTRSTVDGVILHGPKMNDSRIDLLTEIGLPFVVHGRASGISTPYSWLDVNNRSAFARATDFLLDLGHRRIALLNGLEFMDFAHRRRLGYEEALTARHLPIDASLMRSEEMTETFGYTATRDMLTVPNPPTAFLVSSIISALGVRRAIEEAGLVMGRDVSIITHDDSLSYLTNGADVPIFTATRSSVRDAGRALSQMLLSQIQNPTSNPQSTLLEVELTVGQSTGPAPAVKQTA
ncbi:LacI family DNA-binding transcriptional regulator [Pseudooctadecabacter jejudonensis]|uniref:HTH-type transcriptional regulator RafR n=1 Tax=Pseudooctadecabacter jejudonensis TaxID=1391910 RepID=A0A1Y5RDT7_9RHOB|nr:substrate-binding domain-containing protein [Pseudooctadecabacter jejudonensis]SLN14896.1 HTH-type transcriptional regulator RafR [Pseudooctadecabacter jejudonensis]